MGSQKEHIIQNWQNFSEVPGLFGYELYIKLSLKYNIRMAHPLQFYFCLLSLYTHFFEDSLLISLQGTTYPTRCNLQSSDFSYKTYSYKDEVFLGISCWFILLALNWGTLHSIGYVIPCTLQSTSHGMDTCLKPTPSNSLSWESEVLQGRCDWNEFILEEPFKGASPFLFVCLYKPDFPFFP